MICCFEVDFMLYHLLVKLCSKYIFVQEIVLAVVVNILLCSAFVTCSMEATMADK